MRQDFLLALAAVPAALAMPAALPSGVDGITVPIPARRAAEADASGLANVPAYISALNNLLKKYHAPRTLPDSTSSTLSKLLKRATANEPLVDQVNGDSDLLYYGSGTVGTAKPQTFKFDFDTGSSDTFIPGPTCGSAQGCPGTTKYNQGGIDEHNTTTITYGSGQVSGENYFDNVTIAGLTATRQNVISLTQAVGFDGSDADSLMGMAFQSIANSGQPPYFQTLIAQGKVTAQEFAFYLGRAKSSTQGGSQMTLGGRDTSKFTGAVTQVPVTSQTYWQVALDALYVNGTSAGATSKGQAAIDTGTTIILAPTAAAAAFFLLIPGSFPLPLVSGSPLITLWAYPCNFKGKPAIGFAGKQFAINLLDFNFGQLTPGVLDTLNTLGLDLGLNKQAILNSFSQNAAIGGTCLAAVASADLSPTQNLYVVGDSFLKNWYSIYSFNNYNGQPSVSFAAAVGNQ